MEVVKSNSMIQSLQIGIGILEIMAEQNRPLKFVEIQELTGLSKSNLYKYINTFVHSQMLYRDHETGSYVLGSKLIKFGMVAADQENVLGRITPYLETLSKKSNCSVTYSIWTENGPMVIKLFNSNVGFNIGVQVGTVLPPGSSAGKTFLAFKERHAIEEWKEKELGKLPSEQREAFEQELQQIRQKEISFANEPIVPSVSSVSFPVFNYQKQLLGAVAVVGFNEQIPKTEDEPLSQYIKEISKQISAY
jgi:DNA-binding IclR family transcriptional regulator